MKVTLIRRWSNNRAGATVDVDPIQGAWLIDNGWGKTPSDQRTHEQVEGDLQPTHITGRPATVKVREETGSAGPHPDSPDAHKPTGTPTARTRARATSKSKDASPAADA